MRGKQNVHTTSRLFISHPNPHEVFATRRLSGVTASRRLLHFAEGMVFYYFLMSQICKQPEVTILQQIATQNPFFVRQ